MKKAFLTAITISALLISLMGAYLPHPARAESGESIGTDSGATLFSPANTTYGSRFLTLNLTLGVGLGVQYSLNNSIDGKYGGPIPLVAQNPSEMHIINMMDGSVELPELSEGSHYLTVYELSGIYGYHGANPLGPPFKPASPGSADYIASWTHTVYFTINSPSQSSPNPSPTPTISPIITVTGYAARIHNFSYVGPAPIAFPWVEYNFSLTVQNTGNATITNADLLATLNLSNVEPVKDYFQSIQVNSLSVGETRQVKGGWLDIQNSSLNVSGLNQTWSFVLTTPEGVLDRQTFSRITPSESPTQQPTAKPSPTAIPTPTPTTETSSPNLILEMAGVIVIVIIVVTLLAYFLNRNKKKSIR